MIHEAGEGIKFSGTDPDVAGRLRVSVFYRIAGTRNVDGKQLLVFEMHRAGTPFVVIVDEYGIYSMQIFFNL